jgi:hypothetical protein
MGLVHAGEYYKDRVEASRELLSSSFKIPSEWPLIPFNPATSVLGKPTRIAFFGLNAYTQDCHYTLAAEQENFIVWIQEEYNRKLFNVMEIWRSGLEQSSSRYMCDGSIYFSNFVKLVLRKDQFQEARAVAEALKKSAACKQFFESLALEEFERLKKEGCEVFVCFGNDVFALLEQTAKSSNIELVHERHFSRYGISRSKQLVQTHSARINLLLSNLPI